jgi:hypothetical protein
VTKQIQIRSAEHRPLQRLHPVHSALAGPELQVRVRPLVTASRSRFSRGDRTEYPRWHRACISGRAMGMRFQGPVRRQWHRLPLDRRPERPPVTDAVWPISGSDEQCRCCSATRAARSLAVSGSVAGEEFDADRCGVRVAKLFEEVGRLPPRGTGADGVLVGVQ